MQDKYVGDIGDFGKYGLLKSLCGGLDAGGPTQLSLGVVWYLVSDEEKGNDGKHISYLQDTPQNRYRFRSCDPSLYDVLQQIVERNQRRVSSIEIGGVLPPSTVFYAEPLTFRCLPTASRLAHRRQWVQGGLRAMAGCDLVFVDPDNGLEASTKRHHKRGPKYVYFDELAPYVRRGQSLVIYHHMGHIRPVATQIQKSLDDLAKHLDGSAVPFALRYHRGTSRAFFVVPSRAHSAILSERAKHFLSGPWSEHFSLVEQKSA